MNQQLFTRIVNESLIKAVQQYNSNQDVRTINEGINLDTIKKNEKSSVNSKSITNQSMKRKSEDGIRKTVKNIPPSILRSSSPPVNVPKPIKQSVHESIISKYQNWNTIRPIDIDRLKKDIERDLKQLGILNTFNYAIFSNDSIIKSDIFDSNQHYWYKTRLFPDDILSRDLYIGICFPGTHFYLSHLSLLKILSILIALLICITCYLSSVNFIRQRRISSMQTDFINHMTHEFKTPITTIGLAADSILSEEVITQKDRVEHYSRMIREENARMNEMVGKLLQTSRLERKELYFKLQDINIHDLINSAIEGISIQIDKRGGRIIKKFEATNPIIQSDPSHFKNLISNLLDNANKYSPDSPEIFVSTTNDQKGVYISVEDKGIGISKKMQSKIFHKFYRLSSDNISSIKGFGLGLSYIKSILRFNKGKIKVYSESGKGSRFVVFLPYSH